jgi:hypothetical protein
LTSNRPKLLRGTVTFLFSDVEGSTLLLRELGPSLARRVAHYAVMAILPLA